MRSTPRTGTLNGRSDEYSDWTSGDWPEEPRRPRDWKKALLVLGLGTLSWVATYVGMLELIQSNMGELSFSHKIIIGFSVAMLMTMIIWLLDQMFAPLPLVTKLAYVGGYVFLTLISVGFGFGFYWKVLESRSEATRSAESAVTQVKTALFAASARLDQLQTTLDQLTQISTAKAVEEREKGTTCPNSRPGDGPRRRLRDADAARFSFASQFVRGRATKTTSDMKALDGDLKKIASADPSTFDPATGTRNKFLQALTRRLELTATGFNAFRTDPQLRQIRTELAERAAKTQFPTSKGGTFACPDPQLQSALRGVVRAIDQLPELGKPQIATVEGAQAVVEAFRRLTTTFYGVLTFKLPPSADELRALQQKAVQSVENSARRQAEIKVGEGGLSKRDYIPLAIAVFVDLCLLLVSIGRPMNRLNGLIPKMREAERGPVYQILSRFDDIHRDKNIRERFEVFRHVVFDFNGDYYVAVPLDAPRGGYSNPEELVALQQEAHLLGNLFASFEKEKIFSRVHNPLLTRNTIRKKLRRQGSKFANSEAFRTYRFRDGAWSEIILGAVMGASRGLKPKRADAVNADAHLLTMPDIAERSPDEVRRELDDTLRRAAGRDWSPTAQTYSAHNQASSARPAPTQTVDPDLHEKYGRYAAHMASEPHIEPEPQPEDAVPRWPYRKPEPPPAEADVALHVAANSNTSPSRQRHLDADVTPSNWEAPAQSGMQPNQLGQTEVRQNDTDSGQAADPDNVIPMPMGRPSAGSTPVRIEGSTVAAAAGPAQTQPVLQAAPDMEAEFNQPVAAPRASIAKTPNTVLQPTAETMAATHNLDGINVRLTERTADFTVPVTDAELPQRILRAVGQSGATQLAMELSPRAASSAESLPYQDQIALAIEPVADQAIALPSSEERDGDVEIIEQIELDADASDDPMLRVAERFAARTGQDS